MDFTLLYVYILYISGDMLDELTAVVDGYNSYFSFSTVKSGYSGQRFRNSSYFFDCLLVGIKDSLTCLLFR